MTDQEKQLEAARAAKKKAKGLLSRFGSINAVGITRSEGCYAVKVSFEEEPEPRDELPDELDGVPIVIRVTGRIRKQ